MSPESTTFQVQRARKDVETIKNEVCAHFGVTREQLDDRGKSEPIVTIRQVAMALAYELTASSLPDVAQSFGKRDHNTVRHAIKVVPDKAAQDAALLNALAVLRSALPSKLVA